MWPVMDRNTHQQAGIGAIMAKDFAETGTELASPTVERLVKKAGEAK